MVFDIERLIGRIPKRLAQFVDGGIDVGVVVYVRVGGPEPEAQLFAGDDFTRLFEKGQEYLINLALELEPGPSRVTSWRCWSMRNGPKRT